jgi:acyl-CoA thioesterase-1
MSGLGAAWRVALVVTAILALSAVALADPPSARVGSEIPPSCATPPSLSVIHPALERTGSRIGAGKPVTIVAMGSSSTQGVGASDPSMNYPSRLEQELKARYPGAEIRVINHGIGGQDVAEELARLDRDVVAEHPDLVIWQLGTNAVLRRDDLSSDEELIRRGVRLLKNDGIDIVLMDLQYAPRVLARPAAAEMERLIAEVAHTTGVGLFRRFEIMQHWNEAHQLAPAALIGPDGLHMTDASYGCLSTQLAEALARSWGSHTTKLAKSPHRSPDAVAGVGRPASPPSGVSVRQR